MAGTDQNRTQELFVGTWAGIATIAEALIEARVLKRLDLRAHNPAPLLIKPALLTQAAASVSSPPPSLALRQNLARLADWLWCGVRLGLRLGRVQLVQDRPQLPDARRQRVAVGGD